MMAVHIMSKGQLREFLESMKPGDGVYLDYRQTSKRKITNHRSRVFAYVKDLNSKRMDVKLFTDGCFVVASGDYVPVRVEGGYDV